MNAAKAEAPPGTEALDLAACNLAASLALLEAMAGAPTPADLDGLDARIRSTLLQAMAGEDGPGALAALAAILAKGAATLQALGSEARETARPRVGDRITAALTGTIANFQISAGKVAGYYVQLDASDLDAGHAARVLIPAGDLHRAPSARQPSP